MVGAAETGTHDHVGSGKPFDALAAGRGFEVVGGGEAGEESSGIGGRAPHAKGYPKLAFRPPLDQYIVVAFADKKLGVARNGDAGIGDAVLGVDPVVGVQLIPLVWGHAGAALGLQGVEHD